VSFDSVEKNARFAKKHEFNFSLLCDTDRSIGLAYGATQRGETRGANRIGVLIGPDGKIRDWQPKVSSRDYPAQVLEKI
jgi:peroxiredoxin Q/BCP